MTNLLLDSKQLPDFDKVQLTHITPAIQQILFSNREALAGLLQNKRGFTWNNLLQPLEDMHVKLHNVWSVISHLNTVKNSPQLREIYEENLQQITLYYTELAQNRLLYKAIKQLKNSARFKKLNAAQRKIVNNELRDFRLVGVTLPDKKRKKFVKLQLELSQLTNRFANNVLDATQGWTKLVTKKSELAGIPARAVKAAKRSRKSGWLFTLEMPSYLAVMTYADSRALRKETYSAYVTRASSCGPNARKWNNDSIMARICKLRTAKAQLVGFNRYAEYSLTTRMARKPQQVLNFLYELANFSRKKAEQEYAELTEFARKNHKIKKLQPWDLSYISEKLRQAKYNISQEELRPYFPEDQVLTGLFKLVNKLFAVKVARIKSDAVWHKDVKLYVVKDRDNRPISYFYLDLYARSNKRGGAWVDDCRGRHKLSTGKTQLPVAYLTCNFSAPRGQVPALFTHEEVITLFHEFGHALQHMLTKVHYASVAGINGIPWDAVEIASQFMEYWCWQEPILGLISKHYKTGKSLPKETYKRMVAAKNFNSGLQMLRQLEFGLFDFKLHMCSVPAVTQIQKILNQVRTQVSVLPQVKFNKFQNGFSHIFAGGYAAGYYSYKWAEVLAADIFSKFIEAGLFNNKVSKKYLQTFLESGGVVEPMKLFHKFRGRYPRINALLKMDGIK